MAQPRKSSLEIPAPGARPARLYVWILLWGPVVLLIPASIVLLIIGLWQESGGVATIGALGIVLGLILPRMKGSFKFGPGGIEGGFWDDFIEEVLRQGVAQGLTPTEAIEVAETAAAGAAEDIYGDIGRQLAATASRIDRLYATTLAETAVSGALAYREAVRKVIERVATAKGWRVEEQTDIASGSTRWRRLDFVVHTNAGRVLVEVSDMTRAGNQTIFLRRFLGQAREQVENAIAAFGVVPDEATDMNFEEFEGTRLIRQRDLEAALAAFE